MIRSLRFISATAMLLVSAHVFTSCEGALDDIFGEWGKPTRDYILELLRNRN